MTTSGSTGFAFCLTNDTNSAFGMSPLLRTLFVIITTQGRLMIRSVNHKYQRRIFEISNHSFQLQHSYHLQLANIKLVFFQKTSAMVSMKNDVSSLSYLTQQAYGYFSYYNPAWLSLDFLSKLFMLRWEIRAVPWKMISCSCSLKNCGLLTAIVLDFSINARWLSSFLYLNWKGVFSVLKFLKLRSEIYLVESSICNAGMVKCFSKISGLKTYKQIMY